MKRLDISLEAWREYEYEDGYILRVSKPICLYITEDGQHRVVTGDDVAHYIPRGWRKLRWLSNDRSMAVWA